MKVNRQHSYSVKWNDSNRSMEIFGPDDSGDYTLDIDGDHYDFDIASLRLLGEAIQSLDEAINRDALSLVANPRGQE